MSALEGWDQSLFLWLNGDHGAWVDEMAFWISKKWVWIPGYALLVYTLYRRLGWRRMLVALLGAVLVITLADQLSSAWIKPWVGRLRPCQDPALEGQVWLPMGNCVSKYGFVSGHASNFFAGAVYLGLVLRHHFPRLIWWLMGVALLVGWSRIQLGVHYPGDILGGAIMGSLVGAMCYFLYVKSLRGLNLGTAS